MELWNVVIKLAQEKKIACRQIIFEYGDLQKGPDWTHISVQDDKHSIKTNEILHILS